MVIRTALLLFVLGLVLPAVAPAQPTKGVSNAALAAAGRTTPPRLIDYGAQYFAGATTVEDWLEALVGKQARAVAWTGGECVLGNDPHPGIDWRERFPDATAPRCKDE